jgi:hypothetical protein
VEAPATVRGRFGHREVKPTGEADGRPVKADQLRVRSMNFGQHWRTPEVREVRYGLTMPVAFVAHLLRRELPEYIQDCIKFPGSEPLEAGLRRKEWPDADQILDDPELCALALKWIAHGCLLEWLGDGEPEESPGYVINTVDLSERQGAVVRFAGTARAADQPVKYQDD